MTASNALKVATRIPTPAEAGASIVTRSKSDERLSNLTHMMCIIIMLYDINVLTMLTSGAIGNNLYLNG